jgi:hypothetical protein
MREILAAERGVRKRFRATFSRIGKKINYNGHSEDTILLKNIIDADSNKVVTNHVWFSYTKGFEKLSLEEGTTIKFEARIKEYKKGYVSKLYKINNSITDYKLSHPTKIEIVRNI